MKMTQCIIFFSICVKFAVPPIPPRSKIYEHTGVHMGVCEYSHKSFNRR